MAILDISIIGVNISICDSPEMFTPPSLLIKNCLILYRIRYLSNKSFFILPPWRMDIHIR